MRLMHIIFSLSLGKASQPLKLKHSRPHKTPLISHTLFPSLGCHCAAGSDNRAEPPAGDPMEVEVKLRLPDSSDHQKLSDLLAPFRLETLFHENFFFDGPDAELSSKYAALRLRFYDLDSRCVLSLKAKPVLSGGVSRVEEQEESLDPAAARACVAEPSRLFSFHGSRILQRVREEFGVRDEGLVFLGGFKNVRAVYQWNGLKLELDETDYGFGTSYEVECESNYPERDKSLIERLLWENGIAYSYSGLSKFAVFRSGKLPKQGDSEGH